MRYGTRALNPHRRRLLASWLAVPLSLILTMSGAGCSTASGSSTVLSTRMTECGQSSQRLRLRMSRRDIASLPGVACATVSRSFTALHQLGYLRVSNREVEIVDAVGLANLSRNTRGLGDPALAAAPAGRVSDRRHGADRPAPARPSAARGQRLLAAAA